MLRSRTFIKQKFPNDGVVDDGIVTTTFYGRENHTRLNSNQSDEDRYFSNIASGNYASTAQRTLMSSSSTTNTFITSLSSLIDQSKLSFLNSSHTLELKVW